MGLTLSGNYTQEKEHFEDYLRWTKKQNQLLKAEDVDAIALEASIYQKELLMNQIRELHGEAQWLSKSLSPGPGEDEIRKDIRRLLEQIEPIEKENIQLAAQHKNTLGGILGKMRNEHKAARGYNNVGFYPEALLVDEKQ